MLVKVLKDDFTIDFREYGKIKVPIGTMTSHKTPTVDNPEYNFVCEFDWIDKQYPEIGNTLKRDASVFGINIPVEMLMPALRVKFLYDESGNCRDIFRDIYTSRKYCRMESRGRYVGWFSVTPDWEEPDCPIRTDILIQVMGRDGKVAATEIQFEKDGNYYAEKHFLFSNEKQEDHELGDVSHLIYRNEKIKYIIDGKKEFKGIPENEIGEDGIVKYTDNLNFEEYKKEVNNPDLIVIDHDELENRVHRYKRSQMKVFKEITKEEFEEKYECMPPKRVKKRYGAFSFFMGGGEITLSLQNFYFSHQGKYYQGIRDLEYKEEYLAADIREFITYYSLSYENLLKLSERYYKIHEDNGGSSEFDTSINDISRATVYQFKKKHGQCFLGKVNLYDEERKRLDVRLVPYEEQLIYNFEYAFVVPCHDEKLIELIRDYNTEKKIFNSSEVMRDINKIFNRIEELGGTDLSWS
ncbi:hypothetical protein GGR21_001290 [Dysgonomonas hofstadii]|uniref:Uncharacterized protein n=1 Tax=Dysgonomonas hofstadii TaxID=637886 RepID=A0A840CHB3_9BACT|nr:hypothetical protein [Dysgonomonas hofstadii]MBB4035397.1 hypothetical protein [Dysgonomonas hofstadii]